MKLTNQSMKATTHKLPAWSGCDVIRTNDGIPVARTINGWTHWANQKANKMSKRDGFSWTAIVIYVPWRRAYRINYAGQQVTRN